MNTEQHDYLQQIYLEMYDILMTFAYLSLKYQAHAEEAVQEAFQITCQKPADLMNSPNPKGWITN